MGIIKLVILVKIKIDKQKESKLCVVLCQKLYDGFPDVFHKLLTVPQVVSGHFQDFIIKFIRVLPSHNTVLQTVHLQNFLNLRQHCDQFIEAHILEFTQSPKVLFFCQVLINKLPVYEFWVLQNVTSACIIQYWKPHWVFGQFAELLCCFQDLNRCLVHEVTQVNVLPHLLGWFAHVYTHVDKHRKHLALLECAFLCQ